MDVSRNNKEKPGEHLFDSVSQQILAELSNLQQSIKKDSSHTTKKAIQPSVKPHHEYGYSVPPQPKVHVEERPDGLLQSMKYFNGKSTTFNYDEHGKVNHISMPDGSSFKKDPSDTRWIFIKGTSEKTFQSLSVVRRGASALDIVLSDGVTFNVNVKGEVQRIEPLVSSSDFERLYSKNDSLLDPKHTGQIDFETIDRAIGVMFPRSCGQ